MQIFKVSNSTSQNFVFIFLFKIDICQALKFKAGVIISSPDLIFKISNNKSKPSPLLQIEIAFLTENLFSNSLSQIYLFQLALD